MMQGDQYHIPFTIRFGGTEAAVSTFADVEICIGSIRKTMSASQITYNELSKAFLFPVTQEETQKLQEGRQPVQIRVKTPSGDVIGTELPPIYITDAISEEVL